MKIAECLPKEQKQHLNRLRSRREKPPNEMTRKDWEEIMGKNRDTYKRVRGAVRRK
ncbi:hypothetical protein LC048_13630 [Mesobacillus subterraneus]|uniref:hypothetical protein n=1 Tax=Mesobacillus subterraneus TaxID=285983 RepID=UPI001CFEABA7|nr:hypothetical protein [Mesobacillus subterraneus]WLR53564.1 hypothetical protein LC048_13630 [Mesobacillus subterraneus]